MNEAYTNAVEVYMYFAVKLFRNNVSLSGVVLSSQRKHCQAISIVSTVKSTLSKRGPGLSLISPAYISFGLAPFAVVITGTTLEVKSLLSRKNVCIIFQDF